MQTHSLALLMVQPLIDKETPSMETFTRLKKSDVKDSSLPDTIIEHYTGPKKPKMPPEEAAPGIYTAQFLEDQAAIKKRQELDLQFFQAIATTSDTRIFWVQYKRSERKGSFPWQENEVYVYSSY